MKKTILFLSIIFIGLIFCTQEVKTEEVEMKITSPEFKHNEFIPRKFTCQGEDVNPTLIIEDAPANAKSLALIMDDPDAPMGTWVHWVLYNVLKISQIEENSIPGTQGKNNSHSPNYHGPCPPSGTHRYFFKIYALDLEPNLKEGLNKKELEHVMEDHILAKAELVGLYKK